MPSSSEKSLAGTARPIIHFVDEFALHVGLLPNDLVCGNNPANHSRVSCVGHVLGVSRSVVALRCFLLCTSDWLSIQLHEEALLSMLVGTASGNDMARLAPD